MGNTQSLSTVENKQSSTLENSQLLEIGYDLLKNSRILCIYHNPCPDGAVAALIFNINNPGCAMLPYDHKDRDLIYKKIKEVITSVNNLHIYFLDVCPLFSFVDEIKDKVECITIIDHHKPACDKFVMDKSEKVVENCKVIFDNTKSACQIVWNHFYPGKDYPDSILHIGNKDIWKFDNKFTELFCIGYPEYYKIPRFDKISSEELLNYFKKVLNSGPDDIQEIIEKGRELISSYREKANNIFLERKLWFWKKNVYLTKDTDRNGKLLKIVQVDKLDYILIKYYIEILQEHYPEYDVLRIRNVKDYDVSYSLRTLNGANVALLAQKYGGNGHSGASGYGVKRNHLIRFYSWLKKKLSIF